MLFKMKKISEMMELIEKLKKRNNRSYKFFEDLLVQFNQEDGLPEAKQKLQSCFAITQYGNFTKEEEDLLSEVIEANKD